MKTQKTIFNVMALISALAVIAPAMAMGENLQPEILEVSAPASTEVVLVAPVVQEFVEATVAPAVEEVVVEGSNRVFDAADFQNNLRQSFDDMAPTQYEIPGIPAAIKIDVEKPQGYIARIGSCLKSCGGSAYNTVLENPKTSAITVAALVGAGLAYKYRGALRKAVSYAFPWFGKKSTNKVVPVEKKEAPAEEAVNAEVTIGNTQPKQGTIEFNMMNRRNKKK
ncbi:hypothetical protein KJZ61_00160 [Candidatus Dependentiae bacterium]|nr:hypothetical protein [Candidatus Dependentiae bacterium]